jgi:hypothetical protein
LTDLPNFYESLGDSVNSEHEQACARAKTFVEPLKHAETLLDEFLAIEDAIEPWTDERRSQRAEALAAFREQARVIESSLYSDAESPESDLLDDDYNKIMGALQIMFQRIPDEEDGAPDTGHLDHGTRQALIDMW